jgi:hypothetical protein
MLFVDSSLWNGERRMDSMIGRVMNGSSLTILMKLLKTRKECLVIIIQRLKSERTKILSLLFPYTVILAAFGEWDLRKASLSGKLQDVGRYFDLSFDKASIQLAKLQAEGRNITRWGILASLSTFSVDKHLCPNCESIHTNTLYAQFTKIRKYCP